MRSRGRHDWKWTIAVGLGVSLVPACSHHVPNNVVSTDAVVGEGAGSEAQASGSTSDTASPAKTEERGASARGTRPGHDPRTPISASSYHVLSHVPVKKSEPANAKSDGGAAKSEPASALSDAKVESNAPLAAKAIPPEPGTLPSGLPSPTSPLDQPGETAEESESAVQPVQHQARQPAVDVWPPKLPEAAPPAATPARVKPLEPSVPYAARPPVPPALPDTRGPLPKTETPLLAALRYYLDKKPADAIDVLAAYDRTTQDLLLRLLPLAARLTEGGLDSASAQEAALLLEQLDNLLVSLRAGAALVIDKMCFCQRIDAFGVYDSWPDDHRYRPGELVRVYVELQNFTSEKCELVPGRSAYITRLASAAEIVDDTGKQVWSQEFHRDKPDQSQTLRHDYFDHYRFYLPELKPGLYTLWISVTEVSTQRRARRALDFHVAAGKDSRN